MKLPAQIKRPLLIVLPSLIYTLLYASVLIHVRLHPLAEAGTDITFKFALDLVYAFAYAWALFFTIRASRRLFAVLLPLLFFTSALASYYVGFYRIDLGPDIVGVLLEAQPALAVRFITPALIGWLLLSLAVSIWLVRLCIRRELPDPKDKMVLFVSACFVTSALLLDGGISRQYLPYNYILAAADFAIEEISGTPEKTDIAALPYTQRSMPEDLAIILIVGESVRPDHLSINGYARDTTPRLKARRNLASFDNVPSCGPFTRNAIPCILTRASYLDPDAAAKETSLISVFKKFGFETAWVDMHGLVSSVFSSPIVTLMREAGRQVSFNTDLLLPYQYDEAMLPVVEDILAASKGRVVMVLHPFGSHWPYDMRVPEKFRAFTPTCSQTTAVVGDFRMSEDMAACDRTALINAYDNTILYGDYVMDEVMKRVENRPAMVIFTSDHGQSLGEGGYFLHGHSGGKKGDGPAIERRVPVGVWVSDKFKKALPKQAAAIARRARAADAISHDYIFHTLLDCAGLEGETINKNMSLCR